MTRVFLTSLLLTACSSSHHNPDEDAGRDASSDTATADSQIPDVLDAGSPMLECPVGINPYSAPYEACSPEGATCREDGGQCGSVLACDCTGGLWNCLFAHPDPVCTCGREPALGDPCVEEDAACGECCPTPGAPAWAPMTCIDGTWGAADCRDVLCAEPAGSCPVNPHEHINDDCSTEGQTCGSPCCGTAIECNRGVWRAGPEADCVCLPQRECGGGTCGNHEYCVQTCGLDDGSEYTCETLPPECSDCSCIPLDPGLGRCEMIDDAPRVGHFCG